MSGEGTESTIRDLVEEVGLNEEEARFRILDDDLWLLVPDSLISPAGEEAVEEWRETLATMDEIANFALWNLPEGGLRQLIWDARERAREALERARVRLEEGAGG
jgi:hypothetical protein